MHTRGLVDSVRTDAETLYQTVRRVDGRGRAATEVRRWRDKNQQLLLNGTLLTPRLRAPERRRPPAGYGDGGNTDDDDDDDDNDEKKSNSKRQKRKGISPLKPVKIEDEGMGISI